MFPGFTVRTMYRLHSAISSPAAPPAMLSRTLSVSNWRIDACPARAKRGADGDLFLASGSAGKQQVRDVRASDQQNQRDRSEQDQKSAAHIADHLFHQRNHVDGEGPIALVFFADAAGNDADVRSRLHHADAGLQTRHQIIIFIAALGERFRVQTAREEKYPYAACWKRWA